MQKPNYFANIPAHVRYSDITPNAKLLYAEITALLQMNGVCFASNKYFSVLYNKNKTTISRWISELKENGFIKVTYTYKEGTSEIDNRYIQICYDGISKNERGVLAKMLKSNTTINNTNLTDSNKKAFFKKPSVIDIIDYCKERNNNLDAEAFIDFYESKDWKIGKNKMKDWKAAVRTWERRETNKPQSMSKIHQHLQKNLNVKEKLKKQFNQ
tara:strand:- start:887 stop:1525 length:639 start_codon:yes stop_codon:yes gene_type:complete